MSPSKRSGQYRGTGTKRRQPAAKPGDGAPAKVSTEGASTRRYAAQALVRIERDGAYANIATPALLDGIDPPLPERERQQITALVYGTTRMRRSCDWYVDRFTSTEPDPETKALLRLGAFQLAFTDTPPYAAVSATVSAAPHRSRGFVNAVLRNALKADATWPDDATRLSYPDWIIERLTTDLGPERAVAAMEAMNEPATTHRRDDGYVQDPASQAVAAAVEAGPGDRVLDLCAAPGGKATAMAHAGAHVVAADIHPRRVGLIGQNRAALGLDASLSLMVADGLAPPFPNGSFDRVLVDVPCSGLGSLRRRPDARWRIDAGSVERLADLQRRLLTASIPLVRPGGRLVYSVCTLTEAETVGIDRWLAREHPALVAAAPPPAPFEPLGRGAIVLPQTLDTDGMFVLALTVPGSPS